MIDVRYINNLDETFSEELQNILLTKTFSIIGCGAQGGYIAEFLARLGVKCIQIWDGDIFETSNLNRQIGCLENNIGKNKALILEKRLQLINSNIILNTYPWYFGEKKEDFTAILTSDLIFLSFDNSWYVQQTREIIRNIIIQKGIPAIDCPNNIKGGFISINTKKDLSHFDFFTQQLIQQKHLKNHGCSQGYKCALIAAEAVNSAVQYFNNSRFAPIDLKLDIDILHHQYLKSDKFGIIY